MRSQSAVYLCGSNGSPFSETERSRRRRSRNLNASPFAAEEEEVQVIGSVRVIKERCAKKKKNAFQVSCLGCIVCDCGGKTRTQSDGAPVRCAAADATELDVVASRKEW